MSVFIIRMIERFIGEKQNIKADKGASDKPIENPDGETQFEMNSPGGFLLAAKVTRDTASTHPCNASAKFYASTLTTVPKPKTATIPQKSYDSIPTTKMSKTQLSQKSTSQTRNSRKTPHCSVGSRQGEVHGADSYSIA